MITSLKQNTSKRKQIHLLLKVILTSLALYYVFSKIQFHEILATVQQTNIWALTAAVLMFNLSKIVSAIRLNKFYQAIDLKLTETYNLKLYYIGMFYNLFLPGSIGGDGYKVYVLKQQHQHSTKQLIAATFLDRVSGLVLLVLLTCIFVLLSAFTQITPWISFAAWACLFSTIPIYHLGVKWVFPRFLTVFWSTTHLSFWVQLGQVLCAIFILLALHQPSHYFEYLTLFMLSSVFAVLPISIGGVGVREIVFLLGVQYLQIEKAQAITFSLMFFAVLAVSVLVGLWFVPRLKG